MKTTRILLIATSFLLYPWCASPVFSQQEGAKKILITKRTLDADGISSTETIVKKGAAAKNFDVDKYVRENRADNIQVEVKVIGGDDERTIVVKGSKATCISKEEDEDEEDSGDATNGYRGYRGYEGYAGYQGAYADKGAFLGVDEDSDEKSDQPGLVVNVVRGSAADRAGLRDNDKIMKLNDTPTNKWSDLSKFVHAAKVGDKVRIAYERNGNAANTEATLTQRNDVKNDQKNTWNVNTGDWDLSGFDPEEMWNTVGVNPGNCTVNVRQKDACLGVFSDAFAEGNAEGSRINDFTDESAAREVDLEKGDLITAINGQRVKSHDDLWNQIAQYKVGDKVKLEYLRNGNAMTAEATLKACQDNSSRVQILDNDGEEVRDFTSWNWNDDDQRRLRERSIITIRRGEGDAPKVNLTPIPQDRSLKLAEFRAFPNPTQGQVTVAFKGESVATTVSFFDLSGRQLFREELNAFNGRYSQQFDLSDYSKGNIVVHVQQGDKVFTEQVAVN